jgi:membrane-anchored protein YejM (alkaline phosphatase superfamily)
LQRAGLRTAAFSENAFVTDRFGFTEGFEVFRDFFPLKLYEQDPTGYSRVDSEETISEILRWFDVHGADRFFLYVHLLPPHCPYGPPPPFSGRFDPSYDGTIDGAVETLARVNGKELTISPRDLDHLRLQYQENLAYGDHLVGRILDALRACDALERTIVVVAADHGEAFLEHRRMLHTSTVYEEMIHVPLIIRFPARFGTLPSRCTEVVELRQVVPTLLDGLGISNENEAGSLLELLRGGENRAGIARSFATIGRRERRRKLAAVVTARYKLIVDQDSDKTKLYDLQRDPGETQDVSARNPQIVKDMRELLEPRHVPTFSTEEAVIDSATKARLRELGYAL